MEYLTAFFVALFAGNLILTGQGMHAIDQYHQAKKFRPLLLLFYLIAGIAVSAAAYGFTFLENLHPAVEYVAPLFFVLVLAVLVAIFYALICLSPKAKAELKPEWFGLLLNTSLFAIAMSVLSLVGTTDDPLLFLSNACGLPLGYVLTFVIFEPIYERISISNAMRGFKGMPLVLLTLSGMCLCFVSLTF